VKWGIVGGYNQVHFESLPRGVWVGCLVLSAEWLVCLCKSARPYRWLGQAQVRAPARRVYSQKKHK